MNDESTMQIAELPADLTLVQAISKAELDQAISTARAYPRSLKRFVSECRDMATLTEQIAGECMYALPRDGKTIIGPSARLAEIVASAWGNCRAGARVVDEGREFVTAQGVFHDLERNVGITYEVRRRITNKQGRRFSADMIAVTANAACSIALRNAVFKGVPKAFWSSIFDDVRRTIAGDSQTIANRRAAALEHMQKLGATQEMVLTFLSVPGIEDIGSDELVVLRGLATAIKDGEITVEEAFAPKDQAQNGNGKQTGSATRRAKELLGTVDEATGEVLSEDDEPAVPHYDTETAIAKFKAARTMKALDAAWVDIVEDYRASGREIPVDVEAVRNEKRDELEEKARAAR